MKKMVGYSILSLIFTIVIIAICMAAYPPWWAGPAIIVGSGVLGLLLIFAVGSIQGSAKNRR